MLGYRAHFNVDQRDTARDLSLEQFELWLQEKGYDGSQLRTKQAVQVAKGVEASLIDIQGADQSQSTRIQLVERKPGGSWTSALTVHVPADPSARASILIDIHSPATDQDQPVHTGIPRLARNLLEAVEAWDSTARLSDRPTLVRTDDVGALVDAIRDPSRRCLLFAAGSTETLPLSAWRNYVGELLRQTSGLAASYVLDAATTRAIDTYLGPTHSISPGTVRTFLPGVELGSEFDARRHRILSTTRIVNDRSQWLAGILGRRARENALEAELPPHLQEVLDRISGREDALLLGQKHPASEPRPQHVRPGSLEVDETSPHTAAPSSSPSATQADTDHPETDTPLELGTPPESLPIAPAAEAYLAAVNAMRAVLGVEDPTPKDWETLATLAITGQQAEHSQAEVAARLEDLRSELNASGHERRNLTRRLEDEQLEHATTYDGLTKAEDELRRLRLLLLQTDKAADVYVRPDSEDTQVQPPGSFVELVANLGDLPGIVFTGDESIAARLDVHDPLGVWASKAWMILLALSDYAAASTTGRCDRDVHGYLLNLPDDCRGYSANKHAPGESEDVQKSNRFSDARRFPVPLEVDPAGAASMMAHFKIAQSGLVSPRLHYLDDVRRTGKVYVGYIGPHLPTKRTN
jgi:hypothetical protein